MASYYGNGKSARGRAATYPCEKTIRARGEDSLSLGTHDAQTSCLLPKLSQDGILLKVGMGRSLDGIRWQNERRLFTNRSNRPGDE